MDDENDTLPPGGTENVTPESDTAEDWDYFEPEEETEESPEPEATDEGAEEPAETEEPEPEAPAQISLPDGTQITLDEAIKGYQRQADYSRKTLEVSQKRQALEADLQVISGITETFIDHLSKMVPPAPDPALAMRDPNAYIRAKTMHDTAMAKVQDLIELGKKPKEIAGNLDKLDKEAAVAQENLRLAERFPDVVKPEGRKKFFEGAAVAAQEAGFTMDDLQGVTDHRLFVLAHWANVGMKAAKARENAKAKVANVPPATPRKPGQPAQTSRNVEATQRFKKAPTLRNAVAAWSGD